MPIALLVLQALPGLLQTGFSILGLVNHTNSNASSTPSPTEAFAAPLMAQLPALISAGIDVTALVTAAAAQVTLMQKENRGPTDAEKADQTARLTALDANYDKAAGNK